MYQTGGHKKINNGFALFYSVIVAGVLAIMAASISHIALQEVTFSGLGKQSQEAFYAADTGLECASYWDQREGQFSLEIFPRFTSKKIICSGVEVSDLDLALPLPGRSNFDGTGPYGIYTSNFWLRDIGISSVSCAHVTVRKNWQYSTTAAARNTLDTVITSQGYNICPTSGRQVERTIVTVTY